MKTKDMTFILFIASLILFGTNGVVADPIQLSSYQIVFMRTLFGTILLVTAFLIIHRRYRMPEDKKQMLYLLISGVSMGVSWIFLYEAYKLIGVGVASMAYYCGPAIVIVLSPLIFKEKLTVRKFICFLIVMFGAMLMCIESVSADVNVIGYVYGFASALAHAVMVIFSKLAKDIDGLENSSLQMLYSFLTVAVYVILINDLPTSVRAEDWGPILFLGFVNTGLGCLLYFSTITKLKAQTVSIFGYLEPLSAVIFAALILGEQMTSLQIIGTVVILIGAICSEFADEGFNIRSGRRRSAV